MLLAAFLDVADRNAGKLAVREPQRELTYGQLATRTAATQRLVEAGTRRPNVGVLLPPSADFAASFFGCLWAGRTVVPLNTFLKPVELASVLEDAGVDLLLTSSEFEKAVEPLTARSVFLDRVEPADHGTLSKIGRHPQVPEAGPDDLAVILYTSGTTGLPRGVALSHRNLHSNALACAEHLRLSGDEVFLGVLPLFHSFGLTATLILPMLLGTSVEYRARFQPAEVLQAIASRRINALMVAASLFGILGRSKNASPEVFRNLAVAVSGGEPLPRAVFDDYRTRFDYEILEGYGLTETSPVVSVNQPWANHPGTVGRPIPGVEVSIKDELGQTLPLDTQGEICVRGPNVMRGYYNRPEDTSAAFTPDGWLRTGDLGRLDRDGFTTITGRKKELIIVAGENVFPREIETVLDRHPAVAESAVIGTPDPRRGEVVVGFVVPKDQAQVTPLELREHCRNHLAGFKVPRHIIIRSDLPRGPAGKILKRALHAELKTGSLSPV
jgi:long-chain acyl-CoA synthetase